MAALKIIKENYFIIITAFLFIYVSFNFFDGERGLFSYLEKKESRNKLIMEQKHLVNKLKDVEKRVSLLSENIDLDYLEILYRQKFFYGKLNDKVYFIKKNES